MNGGVTLQDARKTFGDVEVIHGVSLGIQDGEFAVFVGPSGCGKSTLLRMIAGLEETTAGRIEIAGQDVTNTEPARRGVAMVFQSYALYPHLSVYDNMAFSLQIARRPRGEIRTKVAEAARILQLEDHLAKRPAQLSGGQRQRVAIGRAIVRNPKVFLFDEPLSNLDAELRVQMRLELARLHKQIGATMIYVTHDQVEAMTMADRIVVLQNGHVRQVGRPLELYENPDNRFVAGFIGSPAMNFFEGAVEAFAGAQATVRLAAAPDFPVPVPLRTARPAPGTKVTVGIRPEHIDLVPPTASGLLVQEDLTEELGSVAFIHARTPSNHPVLVERRGSARPATGNGSLRLVFQPDRTLLFDEAGQRLR